MQLPWVRLFKGSWTKKSHLRSPRDSALFDKHSISRTLKELSALLMHLLALLTMPWTRCCNDLRYSTHCASMTWTSLTTAPVLWVNKMWKKSANPYFWSGFQGMGPTHRHKLHWSVESRWPYQLTVRSKPRDQSEPSAEILWTLRFRSLRYLVPHVLCHPSFPFRLFSLIGCDMQSFIAKWHEFQALFVKCPHCVDAAFQWFSQMTCQTVRGRPMSTIWCGCFLTLPFTAHLQQTVLNACMDSIKQCWQSFAGNPSRQKQQGSWASFTFCSVSMPTWKLGWMQRHYPASLILQIWLNSLDGGRRDNHKLKMKFNGGRGLRWWNSDAWVVGTFFSERKCGKLGAKFLERDIQATYAPMEFGVAQS